MVQCYSSNTTKGQTERIRLRLLRALTQLRLQLESLLSTRLVEVFAQAQDRKPLGLDTFGHSSHDPITRQLL